MKTTLSWWKAVLVGCGAMGLVVVLCLGSMLGLAFWSSRKVMTEFDALASRTTAGSSLSALLADPFTQRCDGVSVTGPFDSGRDSPTDSDDERRALLGRLAAHPGATAGKGTVDLMWFYAPPFGRVFLRVEFEDGKVTSSKTSALD